MVLAEPVFIRLGLIDDDNFEETHEGLITYMTLENKRPPAFIDRSNWSIGERFEFGPAWHTADLDLMLVLVEEDMDGRVRFVRGVPFVEVDGESMELFDFLHFQYRSKLLAVGRRLFGKGVDQS